MHRIWYMPVYAGTIRLAVVWLLCILLVYIHSIRCECLKFVSVPFCHKEQNDSSVCTLQIDPQTNVVDISETASFSHSRVL